MSEKQCYHCDLGHDGAECSCTNDVPVSHVAPEVDDGLAGVVCIARNTWSERHGDFDEYVAKFVRSFLAARADPWRIALQSLCATGELSLIDTPAKATAIVLQQLEGVWSHAEDTGTHLHCACPKCAERAAWAGGETVQSGVAEVRGSPGFAKRVELLQGLLADPEAGRSLRKGLHDGLAIILLACAAFDTDLDGVMRKLDGLPIL